MTVAVPDPVQWLAELPGVARACTLIQRTDSETLRDQRTIASIPSPPFGEAERGRWMRQAFQNHGLQHIEVDVVGNVTGMLRGADSRLAPVVVAAHLDTVFPADTKLTMREHGKRLLLPGIADNARGLAAVLALIRVTRASGITPRRNILFAATAGEEGVGDLRGVKHLFRPESELRAAAAFIALDGTETRRIVTRGVGSRRYRITVRGRGGHSWADRGAPNPAHALGVAIADLSRVRLHGPHAWTLNVGRIGGGTSINAIPEGAWLELDLRSDAAGALATLEARALDAVRNAVERTNAERRRGTPALDLEIAAIGERPAGETPADAPLVQAARAATRYIGRRPELVASSTDANVPMALGIPAIAMGAGGESGGTHTLQEWFENRRGPEGIVRALLTLLSVAGVAD